jgi:hypothetical protein
MDEWLYCELCGQELEIPNARCGCRGCYIDYCPWCGKKYSDDDFHYVRESRGEFWGAPCSEEVIDYITCHYCGGKLEI